MRWGFRILRGWAEARLPRLRTDHAQLNEFYRRSILSVILCRRERDNFVVTPFYDLGFSRGAATPWDMIFAGSLLAQLQLDPEGLLGMLLAFFASGSALACSYLSWEGKPYGWYAQTPFSLLQMLQEYIRHTGNARVLDRRAGSSTVFECLKSAAVELLEGYLRPDGLIDLGPGTKKLLEICTDGYQHTIPAVNALAADYLHALARLCQERGDASAERFAKAGDRMQAALQDQLWNPAAGWYECSYPDGSRHLVLSYHVFDMLSAQSVPADRKRRLAERIRAGEFLATYGMYSIAPTDRVHFDMEDCDWGGGGQYVGQPPKIAEMLYRMGEPDRAWDLLSRCTRWVERFPYFPQTIYAEALELQPHQIDWPLQLSAGAGAQAVIAGVFGFLPHSDGSVEIAPNHNPSLGNAELAGCQFRGQSFSIRMDAGGFRVARNGIDLATVQHGSRIRLDAAGRVKTT